MRFELDALFIEEACRESDLARRVTAQIPAHIPVHYVEDARSVMRAEVQSNDTFGAAKRRMVLMNRRTPFLMGCPAGSQEFACCGYLVMVLASNCPMDCSYCFLQEYVADNPAWQIYANYARFSTNWSGSGAVARVVRCALALESWPIRSLSTRVTGISRELVQYFATRENLLLELKTKTDEIDGLLEVDPRGRTLVSWTLSPERVYRSSEHRTASPASRIIAAARMLDSGYKVAFHLDPIIAYPEAESDYAELFEQLFDRVAPQRISFMSMGGLRLTPKLRTVARRRFPRDSMLIGEEVLSSDGRYRAFTPLRFRLYAKLREQLVRANPQLPIYLCMENASVHHRVFGAAPPHLISLGARLAES